MKNWLVEFDEQELCGWPRKCVELVWDVGPSSITCSSSIVLLSDFRMCEPTRTLMSFVSTNNLMLVTFKSPQIRRLSGIRAYFEVIPEQSKFPSPKKVTCRNICYDSCLISPEAVGQRIEIFYQLF